MMTGAGILPGPFARADERGLDETLGRARAGGEGVGRGLRAAHDSAPPGRAGKARPEDRPGLLPVPAARRRTSSRRRRCCSRRAARSAIDLAQPPARQPDEPAADPGVHGALEALQREQRDPLGRDRLEQHLHVLGRSRHQGVHEDGRLRRGRRCSTPVTRCCARWRRRAPRRSPPSTASRSAAAASWRWPATSAWRRSRRPSASPRSTSASSPASAARSGCRGWSARARRSR